MERRGHLLGLDAPRKRAGDVITEEQLKVAVTNLNAENDAMEARTAVRARSGSVRTTSAPLGEDLVPDTRPPGMGQGG